MENTKQLEEVIQFDIKDLEKYNLIPIFIESYYRLKKYTKNEIERIFTDMNANNKLLYMKRKDLENDPKYRHLICYFVLIDSRTKELVVYQRNNPSENRLNNKYSIGWGGHIRKEDFDYNNINNILSREFEEEITISKKQNYNISDTVFILQDNKSDVGKVHIGLVYFIFVDNLITTVSSNESENVIKLYSSIELLKDTLLYSKLNNNTINMESWSSYIINDDLQKILVNQESK